MNVEKDPKTGPIINTDALKHQTGIKLKQLSTILGNKGGAGHKLAVLAARAANKLDVETLIPEAPAPQSKSAAESAPAEPAKETAAQEAEPAPAEPAKETAAQEAEPAPAEPKNEPEAQQDEPAKETADQETEPAPAEPTEAKG